MVRPEVKLLSDNAATRPPAMLDMVPGDVLVVYDIRRYENVVLQLTEMAREQGAEIILIPPPALPALPLLAISRRPQPGTVM